MANTPRTPKRFREKVKLALIPLLSAILLAVLSDDGETPSPEATPAVALALRSSSATPTRSSPGMAGRTNSSRPQEWPTMPLGEILAHNPFAFPDALLPVPAEPPPVPQRPVTLEDVESANRQELLDQWQSAQITAFYRSKEGPVAIVRSRVLSEGDVLEGGLRVIEIRPDGITYGWPER